VFAWRFQVFTHNLATSVGLSNADSQALLIAVGPSSDVTEYLSFLSDNLFSRLPSSVGLQQQSLQETLEKIDELCWMICSKGYSGSDGSDGNSNTVKCVNFT
jgi:hypothetical protein